MAKRDTTDEPLTDLQQALQAVDDSGENPLQSSEGSDFGDTFLELAAKVDDSGEYVFKTPEAVALAANAALIPDPERQREAAKDFKHTEVRVTIPVDEKQEPSSGFYTAFNPKPEIGRPSSTIFGAIPATDHDTLSAEVDQITTTRATTHGRYRDTARISQSLKRVVHMELDDRLARGQPDLTDQQLESIDLICTKLARIFSGDNNSVEHWQDIGGYAQIAIEDK